jgi:YD repeat-containing protein
MDLDRNDHDSLALELSAALHAGDAMPARQRFVGVWNLVSFRDETAELPAYPYTEQAIGRLTYDQAGRMSAQMMRPGRISRVKALDQIAEAGLDDLRGVADGFVAYFGTFDLDEAAGTVIHHVEAGTLPAWVGQDLVRTYEFSGNLLVLATGSFRLVWERLLD